MRSALLTLTLINSKSLLKVLDHSKWFIMILTDPKFSLDFLITFYHLTAVSVGGCDECENTTRTKLCHARLSAGLTR